jgi:TonB family protein
VERVEERPLAETAAAETTIIASETETEAVQPPEPLAIDIDTSAFIGAFRAVIQENLYYPKNAHRAGITGEVKILVVFNADGSVLSYEALDGSYHKSLGKAAFSTLEAVRDKWQPPMDLGSEQTVIIPIIFEITVK